MSILQKIMFTIFVCVTIFAIQPALGVSGDLGAAADYALLGLQNGTVIVNSATTVTGDFGYSAGVTSTSNQKIGEDYLGQWTGAAYVHTGADFQYTDKNYIPSLGIVSNLAEDARLNQANIDALAAWNFISGLAPTTSLGAIDRTNVSWGAINGVQDLHILEITSLDMNSNFLSLTGDADDVFIFNILGNFQFSDSEVQLLGGLTASTVLFNFPDSGTQTKDVLINKGTTIFNGTILAPDLDGYEVEYHNPAIFNGAIIATKINVHSDFNLNYMPFEPPFVVPEPATFCLLGLGGMTLLRKRRA